MIASLLRFNLNKTIKKEHLINLLGESEGEGVFSNDVNKLIYRIDDEDGLGLDSIWLIIQLENNSYLSYKIITD